ncbi:hypothetical protein CBOM_00794 [Ceraceosorus bombacis]|uniref:Uncharacterized protein n=1 Tax=Ceraceosorus bombacis TaxID=401625 RepID=A0A0P1BB19_9BASI|nr:hypothetical protein CBOM_00794 [Ceraceosorus bombacis]
MSSASTLRAQGQGPVGESASTGITPSKAARKSVKHRASTSSSSRSKTPNRSGAKLGAPRSSQSTSSIIDVSPPGSGGSGTPGARTPKSKRSYGSIQAAADLSKAAGAGDEDQPSPQSTMASPNPASAPQGLIASPASTSSNIKSPGSAKARKVLMPHIPVRRDSAAQGAGSTDTDSITPPRTSASPPPATTLNGSFGGKTNIQSIASAIALRAQLVAAENAAKKAAEAEKAANLIAASRTLAVGSSPSRSASAMSNRSDGLASLGLAASSASVDEIPTPRAAHFPLTSAIEGSRSPALPNFGNVINHMDFGAGGDGYAAARNKDEEGIDTAGTSVDGSPPVKTQNITGNPLLAAAQNHAAAPPANGPGLHSEILRRGSEASVYSNASQDSLPYDSANSQSGGHEPSTSASFSALNARQQHQLSGLGIGRATLGPPTSRTRDAANGKLGMSTHGSTTSIASFATAPDSSPNLSQAAASASPTTPSSGDGLSSKLGSPLSVNGFASGARRKARPAALALDTSSNASPTSPAISRGLPSPVARGQTPPPTRPPAEPLPPLPSTPSTVATRRAKSPNPNGALRNSASSANRRSGASTHRDSGNSHRSSGASINVVVPDNVSASSHHTAQSQGMEHESAGGSLSGHHKSQTAPSAPPIAPPSVGSPAIGLSTTTQASPRSANAGPKLSHAAAAAAFFPPVRTAVKPSSAPAIAVAANHRETDAGAESAQAVLKEVEPQMSFYARRASMRAAAKAAAPQHGDVIARPSLDSSIYSTASFEESPEATGLSDPDRASESGEHGESGASAKPSESEEDVEEEEEGEEGEDAEAAVVKTLTRVDSASQDPRSAGGAQTPSSRQVRARVAPAQSRPVQAGAILLKASGTSATGRPVLTPSSSSQSVSLSDLAVKNAPVTPSSPAGSVLNRGRGVPNKLADSDRDTASKTPKSSSPATFGNVNGLGAAAASSGPLQAAVAGKGPDGKPAPLASVPRVAVGSSTPRSELSEPPLSATSTLSFGHERIKLAETRFTGAFSEIARTFKQQQAEKKALERIIRATTPLEGLGDAAGLGKYLTSMTAKLELTSAEIRKLLDLLDQQKAVMDYMLETHQLELDSQEDEIDDLRDALESALEQAETAEEQSRKHQLEADKAHAGMVSARAETHKVRTRLADEENQRERAVTLLRSAREELSKADVARKEAQQKHLNAEQEASHVRSMLAPLQAQLTQMSGKMDTDSVQRKLETAGLRDELEEDHARALKELKEEHDANVEDLQERVAALELEVEQRDSAVQKAQDERDARVKDLNIQLEKVYDEMADAMSDNVAARKRVAELEGALNREGRDDVVLLQRQIAEAEDRHRAQHKDVLTQLEAAQKAHNQTQADLDKTLKMFGTLDSSSTPNPEHLANARKELEQARSSQLIAAGDLQRVFAAMAAPENHNGVSQVEQASRSSSEDRRRDSGEKREVERERDELLRKVQSQEQDIADLRASIALNGTQIRTAYKQARDELRRLQVSGSNADRKRNNAAFGYISSNNNATGNSSLQTPAINRRESYDAAASPSGTVPLSSRTADLFEAEVKGRKRLLLAALRHPGSLAMEARTLGTEADGQAVLAAVVL